MKENKEDYQYRLREQSGHKSNSKLKREKRLNESILDGHAKTNQLTKEPTKMSHDRRKWSSFASLPHNVIGLENSM